MLLMNNVVKISQHQNEQTTVVAIFQQILSTTSMVLHTKTNKW